MSKKEKLSKEEKAELKAQKKEERKVNGSTPEAIETKQTIIKAATAVVCVIALCLSSTSAIGKYCEALTKAAEAKGTAVSTSDGTVADDTSYVDAGSDVTADDATATDTTADATTDDTTAAGDATAADSGSTSTATATTDSKSTATTANDITKYNKAHVVEYYNKVLKDTYAKKVKMTKVETIAIKVDEASGGDVVTNFVNNTILPKYAGTTNSDRTLSGTKDDLENNGPNFASPYKLTADGAKTATITKNGSNYEITIVTVAEKSTLENPPKINSSCSHPLDLSTVDISPAKVTKADFTYPGTTLKCTVDANGKVLQTSINQPLSGTGEGKLGISLHATLSGSLKQEVKYTYL